MAEPGADQKPAGSDPVALAEQRDKSAWKALLANPLSVAVAGGILTLMTSIVTSFLTARANLEAEQERAVFTRQSAQQALQADLIKKFVDGPPEIVRGNLHFLADTGLIPDYASNRIRRLRLQRHSHCFTDGFVRRKLCYLQNAH
jgi:hypothetical protein